MQKIINKHLLPKLYVVGHSNSYANYLTEPNDQVHVVLTNDPAEADLAMFTGGEDVNPATYSQPIGKYTSFSNRDKREVEAYEFFKELEIPMIGICRGLQLFAALEGGRLVQHISGHTGRTHNVVFENYNLTLPITSAHHQMIDPTRIKQDWEILGISEQRLSNTYLDGDNKEINGIDTEIECVYFPKSQALGIQGHPEWMDANCATVKHWREMIREKLL